MKKMKQPTPKRADPVISWKQEGFASGMYKDAAVPASKIPNNALRLAFNMLQYPEHAEVRPAIEFYSDLEQPVLPGRGNYWATKTGNIITKTHGPDFTQEDVDNYFVWPHSGRRDLITVVLGGSQIQVKFDAVEQPATNAKRGKIIGPENALKLWHDPSGKLFAFFDNRVFWTDWQMTAWHQVYMHSAVTAADMLVDNFSNFDAYKNTVYLFNANGVFVIDTTQEPMEMWKANTSINTSAIAEVAESGINIHGRRYTYSSARLDGVGNRARDTGARIQQETGTNRIDPDNDDKDYAEVWNANTPGNTTPVVVGPIAVPVGSQHFTHIPVYASTDLSLSTTDAESLIWLYDVLVAKALDAYRDNATGHIHIAPGGYGQFQRMDQGTTIQFADGSTDTLGAYVSPSEMAGSGILSGVAGQGAAIGGGRIFTAHQAVDVITRVGGDNFYPADKGKTFWWADGYRSYIIEWMNANQVRVQVAATHNQQGGTMDPISRYFADVVPDTTLEDRKKIYALDHRLWSPFPAMDMGVVVPGFMMVAQRNGYEFNYGQMGITKEYLAGFHNNYYQTYPLKDSISSMEEFRDRLVIYCSTSTRWAPTNASNVIPFGTTGLFLNTLAGVGVADAKIGVKDVSSIVTLPDGNQIVITSEPGVRIFNGKTYSRNLALDPEGRSYLVEDLQKLQAAVAAGYDEKLGYIIFGSDDYPDT